MVKVHLNAVAKVRVGHNCTQHEGSTQGKKVPGMLIEKNFLVASMFQEELTLGLHSHMNIWCVFFPINDYNFSMMLCLCCLTTLMFPLPYAAFIQVA